MTKTEEGAQGPAASESTELTVLVVGLGIAGLTAAIECRRKGHRVIGFEKKPDTNQLGDLLGLSRNSTRVVSQWYQGSLVDFVGENAACFVKTLEFHDLSGVLRAAIPYNTESPIHGELVRRTGLLLRLYQYAVDLGIDLRFGAKVEQYWETASSAGVYIGNEKVAGDCVIAADGLCSKGRLAITQEDLAVEPIEIVAYRSIFNVRDIANTPDAQWLLDKTPTADVARAFQDKNIIVNMGTAAKGRYVWWSSMLRGIVKEDSHNWMKDSTADPVLDCIMTWPVRNKLAAVISQTPPGTCFNHNLVATKPLWTWISPGGRMVVIGDAAHPFLPAGGQGANQAIEDAAVVAICLERAGKGNVPLGLRVFEKLRYKRISLIQQGAIDAMDSYLTVNWDSNGEADRIIAYMSQSWIYDHDCVQHTYEEFDTAADAVLYGREYHPTNIPADEKYLQE